MCNEAFFVQFDSCIAEICDMPSIISVTSLQTGDDSMAMGILSSEIRTPTF